MQSACQSTETQLLVFQEGFSLEDIRLYSSGTPLQDETLVADITGLQVDVVVGLLGGKVSCLTRAFSFWSSPHQNTKLFEWFQLEKEAKHNAQNNMLVQSLWRLCTRIFVSVPFYTTLLLVFVHIYNLRNFRSTDLSTIFRSTVLLPVPARWGGRPPRLSRRKRRKRRLAVLRGGHYSYLLSLSHLRNMRRFDFVAWKTVGKGLIMHLHHLTWIKRTGDSMDLHFFQDPVQQEVRQCCGDLRQEEGAQLQLLNFWAPQVFCKSDRWTNKDLKLTTPFFSSFQSLI